MTQPRRILWAEVFVTAALLLPNRAAAQNSVTPMVKPTPPGQLIVVNNVLGANHTDPHVDGDLGNGVGVPGAVVSIVLLDQNGQPVQTVATATTDITGLYFFATVSVLNQGLNYTVAETGLPPGFLNTPPPSPAFMWSGSGIMIGNFVLTP